MSTTTTATQNGVALAERPEPSVAIDIANETAQWELMTRQAAVLVKSGMLPKAITSPEACIAIMQAGREYGLSPMQSVRTIDFIQGQIALRAHLMVALVNRYCRQHGGYIRQVALDEQACTIEYQRESWPDPQTFTYTIKDAEAANLLGKDNWKRHRREMLYNRAAANACRMGWPDVVLAVYDPDEIEHTHEWWDAEMRAETEGRMAGPGWLKERIQEVSERRNTADAEGPETSAGDQEPAPAQEPIDVAGSVVETQAQPDAAPETQPEDTGEAIVQEYLDAIAKAQSLDELGAVGARLKASGVSTSKLGMAYQNRVRELNDKQANT